MDDDLIILDDEMHLLADLAQGQQQQQHLLYAVNPGPSRTRRQRGARSQPQPPPPPPQRQPATRGRGVKRARNGDRILPAAADMMPGYHSASSDAAAQFNNQKSVIVDGHDVYYIEEVDDSSSGAAGGVATTQVPYLSPSAILGYPPDDDGADTDEAPEAQEQQLSDELDYYNVEPLELSDIWNDLITANQEILILLELSDLKAHIVDARRIEEQIKDMVCEYCHNMFPDIKTLDRHIKKVHFLTEQFECDSCDGTFRHFARFKDHLNGHTGDRVYQCDECNHQYAFRMGFLVHKILDHMKLNGVYVCPKCDLDCRDAQHYKLHIASHIEFGPSSTMTQQLPAAQVSVAPAAAAAAATARLSNGAAVRKPTGFAKENERNKFLNVFESFSKSRNVEQALPTASGRYKKKP